MYSIYMALIKHEISTILLIPYHIMRGGNIRLIQQGQGCLTTR